MLDKRTVHQKLQEQCDCFATTDPLREMAALGGEPDPEEGALKWIALAVLHGIGRNASKISLRRTPDGKVFATAQFRETELPELTPEIGDKVFEAARNITHLEKGKMPVVIGIGDSSVQIDVKLESEEGGESLVLKFPS